MKKLILPAAVMAAAFASPLAAQTGPHDAKAREIYARVISFRTAAGQAQTPTMVAYLIEYGRGTSDNKAGVVALVSTILHQMFIPIAVERMRKTAPKGADLESWNY